MHMYLSIFHVLYLNMYIEIILKRRREKKERKIEYIIFPVIAALLVSHNIDGEISRKKAHSNKTVEVRLMK